MQRLVDSDQDPDALKLLLAQPLRIDIRETCGKCNGLSRVLASQNL